MLLEEHFHEVEGTSYTDAHESGYEVLPDDMVIKNYLTQSGEERFEMRAFPVSFSIPYNRKIWRMTHLNVIGRF